MEMIRDRRSAESSPSHPDMFVSQAPAQRVCRSGIARATKLNEPLERQTWSTYGAERTQTAASVGKAAVAESGSNKPIPSPTIANGCAHNEMVRNAMKKGLPG
jgi:hypothetical protein